jgi:hypothetical protein
MHSFGLIQRYTQLDIFITTDYSNHYYINQRNDAPANHDEHVCAGFLLKTSVILLIGVVANHDA